MNASYASFSRLSPFHNKGMSLIETVVALALGSIVTLGVTQLFVANSETYNVISGQSRMQESARFALSNIARSAEMAGYKGCFSAGPETNKTFIAGFPYEYDIGTGLLGYEGGGTGWLPDIENVLPKTIGATDTNVYVASGVGAGNGIDTGAIIQGTDILTINYLSDQKHRLETLVISDEVDTDVAAAADFNFGVDEIVFIHDCEKGTAFRVTGFNGTLIQHETDVDADGFTNAALKLPAFNSFDTDAYVSAINSYTYFIAPGESVNNLGNTPLSLWRKAGISAPQELLEGIEDLQVQYGVDTDNNDVPNAYVDADSVLDFSDVLTVRITVVANSVDSVESRKPPTHGCTVQDCLAGETFDGLLRRTFTQTIALRNRG